jgi:hypothetical protein
MTKLITIKCEDQEYSVFTEYAKSNDLTLSQLVRHSVRAYMKANSPAQIAPETAKTKPKPPTKHDWDALEHESVSLAQQRGIDPNNYDRPIKPPSSLPKPIDNVLKSWE